jgi:nucleoside-diphosphate kinase
MAIERTFAMIKPDGVKRAWWGGRRRIEAKGFRIVGLKLLQIPRETAERHYGEHAGKPFYEGLVSFITSGPVVAMVLEGENAIAEWRKMMGATNPKDAAPGTIRGDLASTSTRTWPTAPTPRRRPSARSASSSSPAELLD